jgi:hypothetical protein
MTRCRGPCLNSCLPVWYMHTGLWEPDNYRGTALTKVRLPALRMTNKIESLCSLGTIPIRYERRLVYNRYIPELIDNPENDRDENQTTRKKVGLKFSPNGNVPLYGPHRTVLYVNMTYVRYRACKKHAFSIHYLNDRFIKYKRRRACLWVHLSLYSEVVFSS